LWLEEVIEKLCDRGNPKVKLKGPPDRLGGPVTDTGGIVLPTGQNAYLSKLTVQS
jgi:hypothetical protein